MINIRFDARKMSLEASGHAMSSPNGNDIVCAAVSALLGTLAYTLTKNRQMLTRKPTMKLESGLGRVSCKPLPQYEGNVQMIYFTVLSGCELIADKYPEFVTFEFIADGKKKDRKA